MQQKTVLLTFYDLGFGGIQTKLVSVANTLATNGVNTILILERHVSGERTQFLHKNVKVIYSPQLFPTIFKKRYYISLLFYSMFFKADSLVVSLEDTSVFVLNWKKFIPFWKTKVIINYDLLPSAQQKMHTHKLGGILNRADGIVAVSKEVQTELIQKIGVSSKLIQYIPNWFDESLDKKNKKLHRIENRFLFAGRFSSQKQPMEAVRVFFNLKNTLSSAELHFYGTGELLSSLQRFGEKEGDAVKIFKPTPHIENALMTATILLLPSKYEGLPFIAIEAMHYGCVVAAYNFPGVDELIDDGVTGLIANNAQQLSAKILKLLNSHQKVQAMRSLAQKRQKQFFGKMALNQFVKLVIFGQ